MERDEEGREKERERERERERGRFFLGGAKTLVWDEQHTLVGILITQHEQQQQQNQSQGNQGKKQNQKRKKKSTTKPFSLRRKPDGTRRPKLNGRGSSGQLKPETETRRCHRRREQLQAMGSTTVILLGWLLL